MRFIPSLWVSWAATGLSCEEENNMVSHFPVYLRATNSQLIWCIQDKHVHALVERMTALKHCSCEGSGLWSEGIMNSAFGPEWSNPL